MPKIRITQIKNLTEISKTGFKELLFSGRGRIMAVSRSKIKNRIVIKKNRSEKEFRSLWFGSNPQSHGDLFSRCFNFLISILFDRTYIIMQRRAKK